MTTIKDIAKLAGVSTATVSRYLNQPAIVKEKTRNSIAQAITDTGYTPNTLAQSFRRGQSKELYVVVEKLKEYFYNDFTQGLTNQVLTSGLQVKLIIVNNTNSERALTKIIENEPPSGLIFLDSANQAIVEKALNNNIPVILNQARTPFKSINNHAYLSFIQIDFQRGLQIAIEHLVNLGHQQIGLLSSTQLSFQNKFYSEFLPKAFVEHNLNFDSSNIHIHTHNYNEPITDAEFKQKHTDEFLEHNSAIICATNELALVLIKVLSDRQLKVPENISIISLEDHPINQLANPSISSIAYNYRQLGAKVAVELQDLLQSNNDENATITDVIECKLIERNSTRAINNK